MSEIKIDEIRRQLEDITLKPKSSEKSNDKGADFSNILKNAVDHVNKDQINSGKAVENAITGKEGNLHSTLIALEKADVSFKLMMQVRNKLMESYKEIMNTRV